MDRHHPETIERSRAAFLGLAVGDALGATTEFMTPEEIRAKYGVHRNIVGGGWLYLRPGQVTDDTEMSMVLARSILKTNGWDLNEAADSLALWMRSGPVDIGATCQRALRSYLAKGTIQTPPKRWDAGNGAAMRMLPVALYTLGDDQRLQDLAVQQAHITHNHPLSDAACVTIGRMVQAGMAGGDMNRIRRLADSLAGQHPEFAWDPGTGKSSAYIVDTLTTVFDALFSTESLEDCLIKVVNRGGDADTTGAIAGMIAGPVYGGDSIPRRWVRKLDRRFVLELKFLSETLVKMSRAWETPASG